MKRLLLLAIIAAATMAAWQPPSGGLATWILGWNGAPVWYKAGPTFIVANGQVDVAAPPVKRMYDVLLAYDATANGWKIPTGAKNVQVFVNGLRYHANNYVISTAGVMTAVFSNMDPSHEVTVDYDL
jgi:hypothetical protein